MNKKLTVLIAGLALNVSAFGLAYASPIDNFPIEDRAADAIKQMRKSLPPGSMTETKPCYLYNPRNFDQMFTVPCDAPTVAPMKMCRIYDIPGFDAAQFTEPCENVERRKGLSGR